MRYSYEQENVKDDSAVSVGVTLEVIYSSKVLFSWLLSHLAATTTNIRMYQLAISLLIEALYVTYEPDVSCSPYQESIQKIAVLIVSAYFQDVMPTDSNEELLIHKRGLLDVARMMCEHHLHALTICIANGQPVVIKVFQMLFNTVECLGDLECSEIALDYLECLPIHLDSLRSQVTKTIPEQNILLQSKTLLGQSMVVYITFSYHRNSI